MITSISSSLPVYFENNAGRILENTSGRYLYLKWSGAARDVEVFRALLNHVTRALTRHGWHKVLAVQQAMQPLSESELAWMLEQWLPKAMQDAGYQYGAVVLPWQKDARAVSELLTTRGQDKSMNYQTFDKEDDAARWLRQQPD